MYNPKHTNPIANNVENHPKRYTPNVQRSPYVKTHTLVLDSNFRRSGTPLYNAVFDINKAIPIKGDRAVMYVESFFLGEDSGNSSFPDTNFDNFFYHVRINELTQPLSYESESRGMSSIVLTNMGHTFRNQNGVGTVQLVDANLFQQRQLTVQLEYGQIVNGANIPLTLMTQEWCMTLVILEEEYE